MIGWIIFFLFITSFVWFVISIRRAPVGYEDQNGFHYGVQKK